MASVARPQVIAIVGGNKDRFSGRVGGDARLRFYSSSKEGGCGELSALLASIRSGGVDEVWILYRWLSHSESERIQRVCRKRGVPVRLFPGLGQLPL